ncbi:MAG: M23 family metallopeptidase [Bacteroidales bacterium]|nr:M23 family metallopeptidase [Bacteroidales bacterium]
MDASIKKAIQDEIAAANTKKASKSSPKSGSSGTATTNSTTAKPSNTVLSLTPEEQALSSSFSGNQGKLPWPVAKGAKTSDFGNYPHPDVPSVMIENKGIDILVEAGTQVRAIFQGEVSAVLDIFGTKVLMIRHGDYITVYQNLANVTLKKGDKVTTKQTIGTVAQSSSSSGYELHFEVWKNSSYLNPNLWLAKK